MAHQGRSRTNLMHIEGRRHGSHDMSFPRTSVVQSVVIPAKNVFKFTCEIDIFFRTCLSGVNLSVIKCSD